MLNSADTNQIISLTSKENCTVKYGDRQLKEGQEIAINRKLYKVEDCHLQRAYQICGTHLWFMVNIVCEAIEYQNKLNKHPKRLRRFTQEKILTEDCCINACTVTVMAKYCP